MSDLHLVAGEFRRLVSIARDATNAVRQARPDRGTGAFVSTVPGAELTSLMQSVEKRRMDTYTMLGRNLDNHADSLDAADKDFTATEEDNGQLVSSIIRGLGSGGVSKR